MGNQRTSERLDLLNTNCLGLHISQIRNYRYTMEDLHAEVYRITNCPYTPSLKVSETKTEKRKIADAHKQKLFDILQNFDTSLLQLWARSNPCQIDYLATIVLEALELWPFTIDILRMMGMS